MGIFVKALVVAVILCTGGIQSSVVRQIPAQVEMTQSDRYELFSYLFALVFLPVTCVVMVGTLQLQGPCLERNCSLLCRQLYYSLLCLILITVLIILSCFAIIRILDETDDSMKSTNLLSTKHIKDNWALYVGLTFLVLGLLSIPFRFWYYKSKWEKLLNGVKNNNVFIVGKPKAKYGTFDESSESEDEYLIARPVSQGYSEI